MNVTQASIEREECKLLLIKLEVPDDFNPKGLFGNGGIHPLIWVQLVCSLKPVDWCSFA